MKQIKYIGGEFGLDFTINQNNKINDDLFNDEKYLFLSSGRDAIKTILLNYPDNFSTLLPSYLCESILQPFKQLKREYDFYKINYDLTADIKSLDLKLKAKKYNILYIINYFGFRDKKLYDYLSKSDKDILIIQDFSHGSYFGNTSRNKIINNTNFIIMSLRKCYPVVDGGLLIKTLNKKIKNHFIKNRLPKFVDYKLTGKLLKQAYFNNNLKSDFIEKRYLKYFELSEKLLDNKKSVNYMSETSKSIFNDSDIEYINKSRTKNYNHLMNLLLKSKFNNQKYSLIFKYEYQGEFPYMLPIRVAENRRNNLRKHLSNNQVYCPVIWKLPDEIKRNKFNDSKRLSDDILCLPIDQRYNAKDMKRISNLISEYYLN